MFALRAEIMQVVAPLQLRDLYIVWRSDHSLINLSREARWTDAGADLLKGM